MPYQGCLTVVHRTWGKLHHQVSKLKCWAVCVLLFHHWSEGRWQNAARPASVFSEAPSGQGSMATTIPMTLEIQATNRLDVPSYPRLSNIRAPVCAADTLRSHFGAPFRRLFFIGRIQGANQRLNSPWRKVGGPCLPCWAGLHWALVHVTWSPFRWR